MNPRNAVYLFLRNGTMRYAAGPTAVSESTAKSATWIALPDATGPAHHCAVLNTRSDHPRF
jgi:hypothetical protein